MTSPTRLASFNILHGRSLEDGRVDTQRLRDAAASLGADVLALQEVDRGQSRSHRADQTAEVAEAVGAAAWRFAAAIIGEPGAKWRAATDGDLGDEPGYGVGLVSAIPVRSWHVLRLAAAPVRSPVVVPGGAGRRGGVVLLRDEPRMALAADLGDLVIATTHLSFVPGWNLRQLRQATAWLGRVGGGRPCVLMGDLNVPGPLPRWATGWRPLAQVKTFPAADPKVQVDHALASGDVPRPHSGKAVKLPLSDHRALVLQLGSGPWP